MDNLYKMTLVFKIKTLNEIIKITTDIGERARIFTAINDLEIELFSKTGQTYVSVLRAS